MRERVRTGRARRKLRGCTRFLITAATALAVTAVGGTLAAGPALAKTVSPLAVITTYLPQGAALTSYSGQLAATGGTKPYAWSVSAGALPAGLTLHAGSGAITGKPAESGTFDFTAEVTDSQSPAVSATQSESITVTAPALSVTTTSLPSATAGVAYSTTLAAAGGIPPYSWTLTAGSLPAGLTLKPNGTIAGKPTAGGTSDFTVEVADSNNPFSTAPASLSITVGVAPLVVTTAATLPTAYAGTPYSLKLGADGGTAPYTWTLSGGTLPAGLKLKSNGTISGTPTTAGTAMLTVKVSDAENPAATAAASLTLTVTTPLTITSTSPLPAALEQFGEYDTQLTASGGVQPYTWSVVTGAADLAEWGITLSPSGLLYAPPITDFPQGSFQFTVKVTDSANPAESATATFEIQTIG
jgi:hypothetical protein